MTYLKRVSKIRRMTSNDPRWHIINGTMMYPRAAVEIGTGCPDQYTKIIAECVSKGWIKPVAYMAESEIAWEILQE